VDSRRGNRGKVNDGFDTGQALDGLAEVRQVGDQKGRGRFGGRDDVHGEHVLVMLEETVDNRPPGLSASTGDRDFCHG
jgi:hypothetical protein